jgi:hypothetical protein
MRTIRTLLLATPLLFGAALAPAAGAQPVDVTVTDKHLCVLDTAGDEGCTVPADVVGVVVTIDHPDSPVWCITVLADCPEQ